MTPEQKLYHRFKRSQPELNMKRMENAAAEGLGDIYIPLTKGRVCWVELKTRPDRPERLSSYLVPPSAIRNSQRNFHRSHAKRGIATWFLIEDNHKEHVSKRNLYLVPGCAMLVNEGIRFQETRWKCYVKHFGEVTYELVNFPEVTDFHRDFWMDCFSDEN